MENKLPEGWELVDLHKVADVNMGQSPPSSTYNETGEGMPFFQGKKEFGKIYPTVVKWCDSPKKIAKKGDILLCVRAPVGPINVAPKECCIGRGLASIRAKDNLSQNYLFYFMKNNEFNLSFKGRGSTFDSIGRKEIYRIQIPIPFPLDIKKSLKVQEALVKKLDAFFKEYDVLKEEKQKAKENHEKILQSAIGKLIELNDVEFKPIEESFDVNPSKREIANLSDDTEVTFVPMTAVSDKEGAIMKKEKRVLGTVRKGYTYFKENDVIFAKITPCMENGKIAIAKGLNNKLGFGSTEFHVFRSKGKVLPEFLYFYLRQRSFRSEARMNMTGTAGQLRVPTDFLKNYPFPVFSMETQKNIIKQLERVNELKIEIDKEQKIVEKSLELLPHSVLTKAFRGELII